jgi:hypothetical protein
MLLLRPDRKSWINEGHMINDDGSPGPAITTSDVYEWAPGGFFIVHSAYGRIGEFGVGGRQHSFHRGVDNYRVKTVLHERTDDGTTYRPSMKVTLIKVE